MGLVGRRTVMLAVATIGCACGFRTSPGRARERTLTFVFGRPEASPRAQWLIALYLKLPFKPMGKQMLLRARPVRS